MELRLSKNITVSQAIELDNYFVFYAFYYGDNLMIYVTDKKLNLIKEIEIYEEGYFSCRFQNSIKNEILFSVTCTSSSERLPESKSYYQYFETKWYKLNISKTGIFTKKVKVELQETAFWQKSEIKNIVSKKIDDKIYWVSDIQNVRIEDNRYKTSWSFQYAITNNTFELPKFQKIGISYSGIKTLDFHYENNHFFVAAICEKSWDKPIILSIDIINNTVTKEELIIPLKKLHHIETVKLIKSSENLISLFNSTSYEYSKKYEFRIYKYITPITFDANSELHFLNNDTYIRNVKWYEADNKLIASYAPSSEKNITRISSIDELSERTIEEIDDKDTVLLLESGDFIICQVKDESPKKTYLSKHKIKTTANNSEHP